MTVGRTAARWALLTTLLTTLVVGGAACEEPASSLQLGLGLQVRVDEAQLMLGPPPEADGGPSVTQVLRPQTDVVRGEATVQLGGRVGPEAVSLLLHAQGDEHHWQVAPAGFDFVVEDELLWGAQLAFSHGIGSPSVDVDLRAVDADGRVGPPRTTTFVMSEDVPPSQLLVTLGWDAPVDLDLHVEMPNGTVIGAKNVNAYEPQPGVVTPADGASLGGYHDFDSNQQCDLDLRQREHVVWEIPPPPGVYRVYVELFSSCEAPGTSLEVLVQAGDEVLGRAGSRMYAFDARTHADPEGVPGLLVLEFEVP